MSGSTSQPATCVTQDTGRRGERAASLTRGGPAPVRRRHRGAACDGGPAGQPHLVPVTFAVDGDHVYTAVDAKPKTTANLRRLRNIAGNPQVALLADHYEADWNMLWWVRADGLASLLDRPADMAEPLGLLAARYPQYRASPPP